MGFVNDVMIKVHRRSGDRFRGMDLLYLTTIGAKTGKRRQTAVARFPDGDDAWLVVASNGGSPHHPAWYHNLMAHPDQAWVEVEGRSVQVSVEVLEGPRRDDAWARITSSQPRFAGYGRKTDRTLPVLRLTPTSAA